MTAFILRARRFLRRIDPNDDPHAEPLSVPALLTVLVLTGPLRALHRHLPERHLSLESFYTAGATLREVPGDAPHGGGRGLRGFTGKRETAHERHPPGVHWAHRQGRRGARRS